ncbi:MAG: lipoprotein insertase outer membrane protein LolB [Steroidobacteraceae bacterium]
MRIFLLLMSLLLLNVACVTQPQRISGNSDARTASELQHWQASGRIGISSEQQSGSAGFNWLQQDALSQVQVRGPVGVGSLSLTLDAAVLMIQASDGTAYAADAALSEMQLRLGASLPVGQLRYWLLGMAAPGEHHWLNADNTLLEQDGWQIAYAEWSQREQLRLPVRLVLTRDSVRILVVIQSWNVGL